MPMMPGQQPKGAMMPGFGQQIPQQPGFGQQVPQQPGFGQQVPQQPTSIKDAYLMRCAPMVKGVTPQNMYYKNQVGTAIYGFVEQLKGPKAPKITGMLIDLNIPEIHNILQNYEHFCMRVEQADQLIQEQSQPAQQ
jgi:hypothetical protein